MLRWSLLVLGRGAFGAVMIWGANVLGLDLALNPVTALLVGFLGVPGLVAQWGLTRWLF